MKWLALRRYLMGISAGLVLSACGGGGGPVVGTAEAVPEATPTPTPTPRPTPIPTQPQRFTQVAPDTESAPEYQSSPAIEYNLGLLPVRSDVFTEEGQSSYVFMTPVKGWIRFPQTALKTTISRTRFPIVVMLHGQHNPVDPSYRGYDYLARNLAQHGYVAVSIDAKAINIQGDPSSVSRGQLILGTLDILKEIDERGGAGLLTALQDKLDFDHIGLMGHSRGGQGLSSAVKFNVQRESVTERALKAQLLDEPELFTDYPDLKAAVSSSGAIDETLFQQAVKKLNIKYSPVTNAAKPYQFRAGMWLAPTNFEGAVGLSNIPLAVLLPSCDGDVRDLQGAATYDRNRYGFDYDAAARMQIVVKGANHNYYNTIWTNDDVERNSKFTVDEYGAYAKNDTYCDAARDNSPRLTPEDQRRGGLFLVNSFMRYFVGGETVFKPYWNSLAQLPTAACPQYEWPCDARVALTVQQDASKRLSIHSFADASSLMRNSLGGSLMLNGFDASPWCDMPYGGGAAACFPARRAGFEYVSNEPGGFRSIAEHMELVWSNSSATWATGLNSVSAKNYDTLSFRVAVVRPFGQEIEATLTDAAGNSATVKASSYSDVLYQGPTAPKSGSPLMPDAGDMAFSDGQSNSLLNMVAIPLTAFQNVNMASLQELRLKLLGQTGKIALADVQFQNMGR